MEEFTFSEDKTIGYGSLKKFIQRKKYVEYVDIDILDPESNLINIQKVDYYYTYLSKSGSNKGGNSIILKLYNSQEFDLENIEYGAPNLILKILKFPNHTKRQTKPTKRFLKEVDALKKCKSGGFQNIIDIYHNGKCKIYDLSKDQFNEHEFYTMEYAKYDLKAYIEEKHSEIGFEEKISLCLSLCEGLNELDQLGFFHRDIKPDNIFMTDSNVWKIGDLGLVDERNLSANEIDDVAEPIGPRGWMSPESMNKYLCEGKDFSFNHNCKIDHQSDIFQLGKVFWYIFQYNAPIGTVREVDFLLKNTNIYSIIKTMLNHSKKKRFKEINEVIKLLKPLELKSLKHAV